jgi:DHA1 family bicyclomycin/chloramphenicol resistance-like MFS transporter
MKRPNTLKLALFLSFLSTLGPLSLDTYLPSLPDIGLSLEASALQVQLTISSYLFGSGIGAIIYGPVSDHLGHRPVLLRALVLYGIMTTACAVAPSIVAFITLRFVQGIAVAGAMALARAMVRDISSGVRAGRELSLVASITGFVPVIAPVIGGALQIWFGWRANFVALLLFAVVIGSIAGLSSPGDIASSDQDAFFIYRRGGGVSFGGTSSRLFLAPRHFDSRYCRNIRRLSGASFVMQSTLYGLSPVAFGASLAISSAGYVLGTRIAAQAMMRSAWIS